MSRFITSPGTIAPATRPRVDVIDPVLPAQGALLLLEPGHPAADFKTAAPVNGLQIPNVAWRQAAAMVGSGDALTLGAALTLTGFAAPDGLIERTAKGGIHGVPSQRAAMTDGKNARIDFATLLKNYMIANPTHDFAVTMALRDTRVAKPNSAAAALIRRLIISGANIAIDYLVQFQHNNSLPSAHQAATPNGVPSNTYPTATNGAAQFIGNYTADYPRGDVGGIGPRRFSLGVLGWQGTVPATAAQLFARLGWGPSTLGSMGNDTGVGSMTPDAYPAWALYWLYVEDLTVSGRTYAQVEAADRQKYLAEIVNPGGRYYGDSFTDPATFA